MQIFLNGKAADVAAQTVTQLLEELSIEPIGVAVAVNQSVVRRAEHTNFKLSEGDAVEIIRAVQGG